MYLSHGNRVHSRRTHREGTHWHTLHLNSPPTNILTTQQAASSPLATPSNGPHQQQHVDHRPHAHRFAQQPHASSIPPASTPDQQHLLSTNDDRNFDSPQAEPHPVQARNTAKGRDTPTATLTRHLDARPMAAPAHGRSHPATEHHQFRRQQHAYNRAERGINTSLTSHPRRRTLHVSSTRHERQH